MKPIFNGALGALLAAMVLATGPAKADTSASGAEPATPAEGEVACVFCCNNSCNNSALAAIVEDEEFLTEFREAAGSANAAENNVADMAITCPPPPAAPEQAIDLVDTFDPSDEADTACLFCCNNSCNGGKKLS